MYRWKDHAFTGHNSPLYTRPDETSESSPGYQLSSDFAIKYWLSLGARPAKLLLGIGAYGRGFNLADPANNGLYAPATSGIDAAMYTNSAGFWGYNEFCEKMLTQLDQWTFIWVRNAQKKIKRTCKGVSSLYIELLALKQCILVKFQ